MVRHFEHRIIAPTAIDALGKEEGQTGVLFLLDILVDAVRELIIIEIREHVGLQVTGKFFPLVVSQFRP